MIRFSLVCDADHPSEGWFRSNADFDSQVERDLVACPHCGSQRMSKALMAPAIASSALSGAPSGAKEPAQDAPQHLAMDPERAAMMRALSDMVRKIRSQADDVGDRFPDEARRIHHGEAEARGIIGRASTEDARALIEEGIEIAPLPVLPEDRN